MIRPKGLGRGLDALLAGDSGPSGAPGDRLATLPVTRLQPGRYQPRTRMDEASLAELAESIRTQGIIQPILVRASDAAPGAPYEIIAGERRWRAAQIAGLADVPVLIRDIPDQTALAVALIENIQREGLNPLEEARGIQRLIEEFQLTHQEAATAVGRSRAAVSNLLRLLSLAAPVQEMLLQSAIDMGHARALLPLDRAAQLRVAQAIAAGGLSVREAERRARAALAPARPAASRAARADRDIARLEEELAGQIGTTVQIQPTRKGAGKIILHYASLDHLEDLLARLRGPA
jgi:ParB family chromosome partitioning protein